MVKECMLCKEPVEHKQNSICDLCAEDQFAAISEMESYELALYHKDTYLKSLFFFKGQEKLMEYHIKVNQDNGITVKVYANYRVTLSNDLFQENVLDR